MQGDITVALLPYDYPSVKCSPRGSNYILLILQHLPFHQTPARTLHQSIVPVKIVYLIQRTLISPPPQPSRPSLRPLSSTPPIPPSSAQPSRNTP